MNETNNSKTIRLDRSGAGAKDEGSAEINGTMSTGKWFPAANL